MKVSNKIIEASKPYETGLKMEDDLNKEYKKCLNNPLYFYENYVIIRDSEGNKLPRTLTPAQEQVVKKLQEYFIENVDKPLLKELWKDNKNEVS